MTLLLCCSILLLSGGQRLDKADVSFENQTKRPVTVFVRTTGQTAAQIRPNETRLLDQGFAVGDNHYLVLREAGVEENQGSLTYSGSYVVYRASTGQPPRPVNIDITEQKFETPILTPTVGGLTIQNRTACQIFLAVPGINRPIGPIIPQETTRYASLLRPGNNQITVVARRSFDDPEAIKRPIFNFAVLTITLGNKQRDGTYASPTVVIDNGTFPGGLAAVPRPSLDGSWKMPDGLIVRFRGEKGYWVEVRHLSEYGFKPGDLGFRGFKNSPEKPTQFKGEVLYRKLGGAEDGWRSLTINVVGQDTLEAGGSHWTRIKP